MSRGYREEKDGAEGGYREERGGADGGAAGGIRHTNALYKRKHSSSLLRYHYSGTRESRERGSQGGKKTRQHYKRAVRDAADSAACSQSEVRVPAYCLLAADSICRNLKDLLQNAQTVQ